MFLNDAMSESTDPNHIRQFSHLSLKIKQNAYRFNLVANTFNRRSKCIYSWSVHELIWTKSWGISTFLTQCIFSPPPDRMGFQASLPPAENEQVQVVLALQPLGQQAFQIMTLLNKWWLPLVLGIPMATGSISGFLATCLHLQFDQNLLRSSFSSFPAGFPRGQWESQQGRAQIAG